ncbi:hypothetical protein NIES4071_105280 (plasmid) [Calothrix sp. NIES-4071]|nr:hypothetical protein NIES4071_105280 [Calothrix sp. NIES-4071]BAZ64946.1 hypothetical protein NIES4105_106790 [Calothrix sp. NIES-4105]
MKSQTEADIVITSSDEKLNSAESISIKNAQCIVISVNDEVDGAEPESDKETESIAQETAGAIARSKSLILAILIFVLGIMSIQIVAKSSCGASFSLKLVPPEIELNSGACDIPTDQSGTN